MLETVDFDVERLSKKDYLQTHERLIDKLVVLQQEARLAGVGLVVLFEGWGGAGKGSRISDLMYNLDARATSVYVTPESDFEAVRSFAGADEGVTGFYPVMQQFWNALGERGTITFYDRGWYTAAIERELAGRYGKVDDESIERVVDDIARLQETSALRARREMRMNIMGSYRRYAHNFERLLTDDGYVVVKLFVHVRDKARRKRLKRLRDNPDTRWRVTEAKIELSKHYDKAYELYDMLLESSNFDFAPWTLVNGEDKRAANIQIAQTLIDAIEGALARKHQAEVEACDVARDTVATAASIVPASDGPAGAGNAVVMESATGTGNGQRIGVSPYSLAEHEKADAREDDAATAKAQGCASAAQTHESEATALVGAPDPADDPAVRAASEAEAVRQAAFAPRASRFIIMAGYPHIDHSNPLPRLSADEDYDEVLKREQKRLFKLEMELYQKRVPLMVMYEGWDAAGKGGSIKRVAQALDARAYTIFPSPAPTKPELAHPHLWRYWTRLPKAGHVGIYDRSWYGRVLVERVEGFASPAEWARAYDEINEFEYEMIQWGAILLKFWVDVTPDEQLKRFRKRESDVTKQWKISSEDWRNRAKYPQYKAAVDDMFRLTSTAFAPWIVLESDHKRFARIKALKMINGALEERLHG